MIGDAARGRNEDKNGHQHPTPSKREKNGANDRRLDNAKNMKNVPIIDKRGAIGRALHLEAMLQKRLKYTAQPNLAKYMDMAETYRQISDYYAIATEWESAGFNISNSAKYFVSLKRNDIAATFLEQAARYFSYAKLHDEEHESLERAAFLYVGQGEMRTAARLETKLGFACKRLQERLEARDHFQRAAVFLREDGDLIGSMLPSKEMAYLSGLLEDYERCSEEMVEIAKIQMSSNLTRLNSSEWFLNACLVHFLSVEEEETDMDRLKENNMDFVRNIANVDRSFLISRECTFFRDIVKAYLKPSMEDFADHVYNFDSVHKFNYWQLTMLKSIQTAFDYEVRLANGEAISESDGTETDSTGTSGEDDGGEDSSGAEDQGEEYDYE